MAANYTLVVVGVAVVVMMVQMYKLQNVNAELRNQMIKSEEMRKIFKEEQIYLETRTQKCSSEIDSLSREKTQTQKKLTAAEANASKLKGLLEEARLSEENNRNNMNQEMKSKYEAAQKMVDTAKAEALRYHDLYLQGNKLLNAVREECSQINPSRAAEMQKLEAAAAAAAAAAAGQGVPDAAPKPNINVDTHKVLPRDTSFQTPQETIKQNQDQQEGSVKQANEKKTGQDMKEPEVEKKTKVEEKKTEGEKAMKKRDLRKKKKVQKGMKVVEGKKVEESVKKEG